MFLLRVRRTGFESFPLTGPVVVIAPHMSFADPIVLYGMLPRPSRLLATAFFVFRSAPMSWVQCLGGALPVVRHRPDPAAVRTFLRRLAEGEVVGLFPEGGRNWTGVPVRVMPQAARLLAGITAPIFVVTIEGGYDLWPRWGGSLRRRPLSVRLVGPVNISARRTQLSDRSRYRAVYAPAGRRAIPAASRVLVAALVAASPGESRSLQLDAKERFSDLRVLLCWCPRCARGSLNERVDCLSCDSCGASFRRTDHGSLSVCDARGRTTTRTIPMLFNEMCAALVRRAKRGLEFHGRADVRFFGAQEADPSRVPFRMGDFRLSRGGLEVRVSGEMRKVSLSRFHDAGVEGSAILEIPDADGENRIHLRIPGGALRAYLAGRALLGLPAAALSP